MDGYHEIDYSADPTVDICLTCKAEKCMGSCARVRAIEDGHPDPGEDYAGVDLRALNRSNSADIARSKRVKELARKHDREVGWINNLLRRGHSFEDVDRMLGEKDAKAKFVAEMLSKGMTKGALYRLLREGRTWDEIRRKVA